MSQSATYFTGTGPTPPIITINGDTGSAVGPVITFNGIPFGGSSLAFKASGSTVNLYTTDSNSNTLIGFHAGNLTLSGIANVSLGSGTLNALTTGSSNTSVGFHSMEFVTTGTANSGFGSGTLATLTTGVINTAVGFFALGQLVTGSYNTSLGDSAGYNYTGAESSNINIGYNTEGTLGESNVLRIGNGTGAGNGQVNKAFICGIDGVNVGSVAKVVTMASDQLGTATITAGTGITVTPTANTITISTTSSIINNYVSVNHAASPYTALSTDDYISADVTGGVITIRLPNATATGRTFSIKDQVGLAATSNITVTTVGGAVTLDGSTSFVMNTAYEAISVIFNGTSYEVF